MREKTPACNIHHSLNMTGSAKLYEKSSVLKCFCSPDHGPTLTRVCGGLRGPSVREGEEHLWSQTGPAGQEGFKLTGTTETRWDGSCD